MYIFPLCYDGDEVLKHIFPTKQESVQKLIDIAKAHSEIKRIIVFGSAITLRCGDTSDLDIAIDIAPQEAYNEMAYLLSDVPSATDILDYNRVRDENLKRDIDRGLCVYGEL